VAGTFRTPSLAAALVASPQPEGELPPLPRSRIGKVSQTRKIDGSPLVFRVDDDDLFTAPSNPKKAYLLHNVRMDGEGIVDGPTIATSTRNPLQGDH